MKKLMLVGNANTGKTTLLNSLTKSEEHTGNWHGVTVEEKEKFFSFDNQKFSVVDLPGIYSLTALSLEEQVSIDFVLSNQNSLILNICDINNLTKNLYLTLDLLQLKNNVVLVVNNWGKIVDFDIRKLKEELGVEIWVLNFENKNDIKNLKEKIAKYNYKKIDNNINKKIFSKSTFCLIEDLAKKLNINIFEIIKIIEKNDFFLKKNKINNIFLNNYLINNKLNYSVLAKEKYNYINKIYINKKNKIYGEEFLDNILLNKYFAIPIFIVIMLAIFYITFFFIGSFFSQVLYDLIQNDLGTFVVSFFKTFCNIDWVNGLVAQGFIAGVGSLFSFLPQVVLLFLFLAIMEDTGYFARIAFIFEDIFSGLGLSGKSVYTLLMSFGCSASAVLTARAMDSKKAKIKTAILAPYMSCSAKLPIYAVLGGAFFGASNVFIIFCLYLLGVFVALFLSIVLDKIGLKSNDNTFLLEFPPYHLPKFGRIIKIAWLNLKLFLIKVSTIFVSMSIIMWCLGSFDFTFNYVAGTNGKSILQVLGEFFAPLFAPLGFNNWGAVAALIGGIVAKEIVVSSIAIFNGVGTHSANSTSQIGQSLTNPNSAVFFTSASAISFMGFCLLYCPCIATIAVMKKEIGIKWTLTAILIQLFVAYIVAFMIYNLYYLAEKIGIFSVVCLVFGMFFVISAFWKILAFFKEKNKCKYCKGCSCSKFKNCKKI